MEQWPLPKYYKINKKIPISFPKTIEFIESFFAKKYKSKYAVLMPSGRSSINQILRYLKYDRSKIVNIPKWSSTCLYTAIGSITNVTIHNYKADTLLIVHKWGCTFKYKTIKKFKNQINIEDSADCLPGKKFLPFKNDTNFEIISLPKIIASYSGGIILTKDYDFYKYAKKQQNNNIRFKINQQKKNGNNYINEKLSQDFFNKSAVNNIFICLKNFKLNIDIINKRRNLIKKIIPSLKLDKERVGPVVIFKAKKFPFLENILEKKFFNFHYLVDKEKYEECFIFPIHFGITEYEFKNKLKKIKNLNA
jgi:putative PLP-dependent aminotransferase (TIGR04422 family)